MRVGIAGSKLVSSFAHIGRLFNDGHNMNSSTNSNGATGLLVSYTGACSSTGCDITQRKQLELIARNSGQGLCDSPSLVTSSLTMTSSMTLFVVSSSFVPVSQQRTRNGERPNGNVALLDPFAGTIERRSLSSRTIATVNCGTSGSINLDIITTSAASPVWPYNEYFLYPHSRASMAKAVRVIISGSIIGTLRDASNNLYTIQSGDVFGSSRVGIAMRDNTLDDSVTYIRAAMAAVVSRSLTDATPLPSVLSHIAAVWYSDSRLDTLMTNYRGVSSNPTRLGFLRYWCSQMYATSQCTIWISQDGGYVTIITAHDPGVQVGTTNIGTTAINKINTRISAQSSNIWAYAGYPSEPAEYESWNINGGLSGSWSATTQALATITVRLTLPIIPGTITISDYVWASSAYARVTCTFGGGYNMLDTLDVVWMWPDNKVFSMTGTLGYINNWIGAPAAQVWFEGDDVSGAIRFGYWNGNAVRSGLALIASASTPTEPLYLDPLWFQSNTLSGLPGSTNWVNGLSNTGVTSIASCIGTQDSSASTLSSTLVSSMQACALNLNTPHSWIKIRSLPTTNAIATTMTIASIQPMTFKPTDTNYRFEWDVDRLVIPMLVTTTVSFTIVSSSSTQTTPVQTWSSYARIQDWCVPYLKDMRTGIMTSSPLTIQMASAAGAIITSTFSYSSTIVSKSIDSSITLGTATVAYTHGGLGTSSKSYDWKVISSTGSDYSVPTNQVLQSLLATVAIPSGITTIISLPIPPLQTSVGSLNTLSARVANRIHWLNHAIPEKYLFSSTPFLLSSIPTEVFYNITINDSPDPVKCGISVPPPQRTPSDLATLFTASLTQFGFGTYMVARVNTFGDTSSGPQYYVLTLELDESSYGVIWQITMSSPDMASSAGPSFIAMWSAVQYPTFGTMYDASLLTSTVLPYLTSLPRLQSIDTHLNDLIPSNLWPAYSRYVTGVGFDIGIVTNDLAVPIALYDTLTAYNESITIRLAPLLADSLLNDVNDIVPPHLKSRRPHRYASADGLSAEVDVSSQFKSGLIFAFEVGGVTQSIAIQTNSTSSDGIYGPIVTGRTGLTFDAILEYRTTSTSQRYYLTNHTVQLTPGLLLRAGVDAVIAALPGPYWPLAVHTSISAGINGSYGDFQYDQLDISLDVTTISATQWIVPVAFGVRPAIVDPCDRFPASYLEPSRVKALTQDLLFTMTVNGNGVVSSSAATGTIGIVSLSAPQSTYDVSVSISAGTSKSIMTLEDSMSAFTGSNISNSIFTLDIDNKLTLNDASLVTSSPTIGIFDMVMYIDHSSASTRGSSPIVIDSQASLDTIQSNLLDSVEYTNIPSSQADALQSLKQVHPTSWCAWLEQGARFIANVGNETELTRILPFWNIKLSTIVDTDMSARMNQAVNKVCNSDTELVWTIEGICDLLSDQLGSNVCSGGVYEDRLIVDVNMFYNTTWSPKLTIDVPSFFHDQFHYDYLMNSPGSVLPWAVTLPSAVSDANGFTLNSISTASLRFIATYNGDDEPILTVEDMTATVRVQSYIQGTQDNVWLGAIRTAFTAVTATIDATLSASSSEPLYVYATMIPTPKNRFQAGVKRIRNPSRNWVNPYRNRYRGMRQVGVTHDITGTASFKANLQIAGEDVCDFSISINDMGSWLLDGTADPLSYTVRDCDGNNGAFVALIRGAVDNQENALIDYFQSNRFTDQVSTGMEPLNEAVLGEDGPMPEHGGEDQAFVAQEVAIQTHDTLKDIIGTNLKKNLQAALKAAASGLSEGRLPEWPQLQVDQIMLDLFYDLVWYYFKPILVKEPERMVANVEQNYQLKLEFGQTSLRPIKFLDFQMGGHGFAGLEAHCNATIVMGWFTSIILMYSPTRGIDVSFASDPVMGANWNLIIEDSCTLEGHVAFIGAKANVQAKLLAALEVPKHESLTNFEGWLVDFTLSAELRGACIFGFYGKFNKFDLTATPFVSVVLTMKWAEFRLSDAAAFDPIPKMEFSEVKICMGHALTKLVGNMISKVTSIALKQLDKILGPDAFLNRKVGVAKFLFGKDMTVAELAAHVAKSVGKTRFDGLFEAIAMLQKLKGLLTAVNTLVGSPDDPNGCNAYQRISDFIVNLKKEHPEPEFTPEAMNQIGGPESDVVTCAKTNANCDSVTKLTKTVVTGEFGLKWHLWESPAKKFVTMMLGGDVPIVGITVPRVDVLIGPKYWNVGPIWPTPPVFINIGFGASIIIDVGEIVYTTKGIRDALSGKGNLGSLLTGLGVPTKTAAGAERWPLQASATISAGVTIKILIFKGSAYAYLTVAGMMRMMDVNGDGVAYFSDFLRLIRWNGGNPLAAFQVLKDIVAPSKILRFATTQFFGSCMFVVTIV
jgi:hypothetical protein